MIDGFIETTAKLIVDLKAASGDFLSLLFVDDAHLLFVDWLALESHE